MNDFGISIQRHITPSPELAGYLMAYEHVEPEADGWWIAADRPRDAVWSDEIVKTSDKYRLISSTGKVLATFKTLVEAEEAEKSVEVDFTTKFKVGAKVVPVETISSHD